MIEKETIPKNKRMKKWKDMLIIKTVFLYFEFVEKIVNAIISSTNSTDQFKSAVKIGENKTTSPLFVYVRIKYLPSSTGFCVGWYVFPSDSAVLKYKISFG